MCQHSKSGKCTRPSRCLRRRGDHNLALLNTGAVVAWGYNKFGELGDGTTEASEVAVPVSGLSEVKAIAASDLVSLALLKNGTVMVWSSNELGQFGNGTRGGFERRPDSHNRPERSHGNRGQPILLPRLLKNGTVMVWGNSGYRQLGDEWYADVPIAVGGLNEVAAIGARRSRKSRVAEERHGDGMGSVQSRAHRCQ